MSFESFSKSFYDYLVEKYVRHIPGVKRKYLNKKENILYSVFRYSNIISLHGSKKVVETPFFLSSKSNISDKLILNKIEKLKSMLEAGNKNVFNEKANKNDRFVSNRFWWIFDDNGNPISDFTYDTIGITHFHIGYNKLTDDNLLFVCSRGDNIYFLCIGSHKDIYIESSGSIVLEAYLKEFPEEAEKYLPKLPADDVMHTADAALVKKLKSKAVNIAFKDGDGNVRTSIFFYTGNRMPSYVIKNLSNIDMELCNIYNICNIKKLRVVSIECCDGRYIIMSRNMDDIDNFNFVTTILDDDCAISKMYNCIFSIITFLNLENPSIISLVKEKSKSRKNIKRITRAKQIAEAKLSRKRRKSV